MSGHPVSSNSGGETLELKGIYKVFKHDIRKRKQVALDELACTFAGGKCTGLLGHNGAGKTTTIRVILGLIRPDRGAILLDGRPFSRRHKAHVGYMPEINKLPVTLTPLEILRFHLALMNPQHLSPKEREAAIEAGLRQVDLWDHRSKLVKRLSKGMGRRLAWVQATIHQPKLLILDEPMSGLDPVGRRAMRGWISDLRARGTTIILCTHELATVQQLCDDIYILRKGRVVFTTTSPQGSLDPIAAAAHARDQWPKYALHVSGTSEEVLLQLGTALNLPRWQRLEAVGYLHKLGFMTYEDAARWLTACLSQGLLVMRFGDETPVDEDELLAHFGKDLDP